MKIFLKSLVAVIMTTLVFTACNKVDDLPVYGNGTAVQLSASSQSLAATAADSSNVLVTFNWTDAKYATASANEKYIVEMAVAGSSFANPTSKTIMGSLTTSFTAKEVNDVLLVPPKLFPKVT
jgi:hypothetical protein